MQKHYTTVEENDKYLVYSTEETRKKLKLFDVILILICNQKKLSAKPKLMGNKNYTNTIIEMVIFGIFH